MKQIFLYCCLLATTASFAQKDSPAHKRTLQISGDGISIHTDDTDVYVSLKKNKPKPAFEVEYGMVDLGVNVLRDFSDYSSPAVQELLNTDMPKNASLFSLRNSKSINVNIYPVIGKFRALSTRNQQIYLSLGAGLQLYNFRFNKPVSYQSTNPVTVITDSVSFQKNKLAFTYFSMPLMVTAKTRLAGKSWLVYGAGITGGYRLSSWTKQISSERGKQKNFDSFNFSDFNACATAEIGIDDVLRVYASYQLNPLSDGPLDQHPLCIGLRFSGI